MKRLTNIGTNGEIFITDNDETRRLGRKEAAYKRLKDYEDAEESGLLLHMLCKVGDYVYSVPSKVNYELNILDGRENDNRVYRQTIKKIIIGEDSWYILCDKDLEYGTGRTYVDNAYGETWFLSSEAAEVKLKELEEYHSTERRICENLKKLYKSHEISESEEDK